MAVGSLGGLFILQICNDRLYSPTVFTCNFVLLILRVLKDFMDNPYPTYCMDTHKIFYPENMRSSQVQKTVPDKDYKQLNECQKKSYSYIPWTQCNAIRRQ